MKSSLGLDESTGSDNDAASVGVVASATTPRTTGSLKRTVSVISHGQTAAAAATAEPPVKMTRLGHYHQGILIPGQFEF